jgi:hypothetical protein
MMQTPLMSTPAHGCGPVVVVVEAGGFVVVVVEGGGAVVVVVDGAGGFVVVVDGAGGLVVVVVDGAGGFVVVVVEGVVVVVVVVEDTTGGGSNVVVVVDDTGGLPLSLDGTQNPYTRPKKNRCGRFTTNAGKHTRSIDDDAPVVDGVGAHNTAGPSTRTATLSPTVTGNGGTKRADVRDG